jgi:oligoribonuclease
MKHRNKLPTKLLWIDLEMTGLDPEIDRIIEVGVIITDFDFNELATYETVIKQDLDALTLDPWITDNLTNLLTQVPAGKDEQEVIAGLMKLIDENFDEAPVILAGNSIHQDRRFIRQWWPELEARLHYRMLDVSSFKIWMMGKHGTIFHKPEQHRALEDIRGSIQELRQYVDKIEL